MSETRTSHKKTASPTNETANESEEKWRPINDREKAAYHISLLWNGDEENPVLKIGVSIKANKNYFETPVNAVPEELGRVALILLDHPPFDSVAKANNLSEAEIFEPSSQAA